jgi:SAM-dependent methyltransferase
METPEQTAERLLHGSSFGAAATAYAQHRPSYADDAIRWSLEPVLASAGGAAVRVADIGAGTGILTAGLASLGADVVAVEPDQDMLAELRRRLPGIRAEQGSAEAIPLPDASVDAVLAGQAMHWFDMERALPEIARVLVPGGVLAGLWNVDDDRVDGWVAELAEMTKRKASLTLSRWRGSQDSAWQEKMLAAAGGLFGSVELGEFSNGHVYTADSLVATIATHSHLLVLPDAERAELLTGVRDFLASQPQTADGEFTLPMVTVVARARKA